MEIRRERELVEMARNGNEDAFRQLVEANMRRVYGLALRFTRKHEDADEVAQETFIRAFRSLDRFKGKSTFGTWVYRIAVNCSLSHKRKLIRTAGADAEDQIDDNMPDRSNPSQEKLAEGRQTRELINGALDGLSKQQRAIFVMKHLQQKKISEIADVLECAEGTVKQQLFRAVRKVREQLAPLIGREYALK
jgi:RNA polymerase sigma-70 factor (ECF subfamily)